MRATVRLLLPSDVAVAPIATLPAELSGRVSEDASDFYITRTNAESGSIVVDAYTAALLEQFRTPSTVIDAIVAFCRENELDPSQTLDDAFATLTDLVAENVLVPAADGPQWPTYRYYETYRSHFTGEECRAIISLHKNRSMVVSRMDAQSGDPLRDCNLFWIHRSDQTDWIFTRLWKIGQTFNDKYGFELSSNVGAAQLTRYMPGQKYDWHMDLGANDSSLRKISLVLHLTSNEKMQGGGIEIFYGDMVDNRIRADVGDVVAFPSFVMHRASMVQGGTRWSLVVWLTGPRPLR